ncbi:hypothetical protein S40288_11184 [Stachybotrys chartarum IBT 40288]|nr:hypothetical protein S40288_11184 [Stachybotrys chartarum IBT 40288]
MAPPARGTLSWPGSHTFLLREGGRALRSSLSRQDLELFPFISSGAPEGSAVRHAAHGTNERHHGIWDDGWKIRVAYGRPQRKGRFWLADRISESLVATNETTNDSEDRTPLADLSAFPYRNMNRARFAARPPEPRWTRGWWDPGWIAVFGCWLNAADAGTRNDAADSRGQSGR